MKLRNVNGLRLFAVCGALGGFGLIWALLVGRANFAQAGNKATPAIVGLPDDWTHHHVVFTNSGPPQVMARAQQDPRYWLQQLRRHGAEYADVFNLRRGAPLIPRDVLPLPPLPPLPRIRARKRSSVDWSVSLGGTGARVADGMYPAKFTFDVNGATDCTSDFVVFALNVASAATQAGIVAFNNLYSVYPAGGPCGFAPTVKWAYNATPGGISTSPVLSLDGTKVAYVENSSPPAFHVLTPGSGGTITSPLSGTGVDVKVSYGATGDTHSPPFVDYTNDIAYVAADNGKLYKFTGVFLGTPTLVTTGGWPVTIATGGNSVNLTGPVLDSVTQRIFIGDGDGILHFVRLSAPDHCTGNVTPPCADSATMVLSTGSHAIVEGPIVDSTNQTIFAFLQDNGSGHFTVTQATTSLGLPVAASVGANSGKTAHIGAFDNAYYTSPSTGHLYVCGTVGGVGANGSSPALYRIGFAGSTMNSTPSNGPLILVSSGGQECSPLTAFFNPNVGASGAEFLFVSVTNNCSATIPGGCIRAFNITGGFPAGTTGANVVTVAEAGGVSGIVVDNVSTASQASSIYFSNLADVTNKVGSNAIKLTQSGLQ